MDFPRAFLFAKSFLITWNFKLSDQIDGARISFVWFQVDWSKSDFKCVVYICEARVTIMWFKSNTRVCKNIFFSLLHEWKLNYLLKEKVERTIVLQICHKKVILRPILCLFLLKSFKANLMKKHDSQTTIFISFQMSPHIMHTIA